MTVCAERAAEISALHDGELAEADAILLREHLASCGGCAAELERLNALSARMTRPGVSFAAPPELRQRLAALPMGAPPKPKGRLASAFGGALGGALAATLACLWLLPIATAPTMTASLIDAHLRALQPGHLIDVATSDRHVVKPWFNGRVDFSPLVLDLKDQGYPLLGGRLDHADGRTMAALVYGKELHRISVFVAPAGHDGREGPSHDGFSVAHWAASGLDYWAVSDVPPEELERFKAAWNAQAGHATDERDQH
jgi:anti-sigma factor RsiW